MCNKKRIELIVDQMLANNQKPVFKIQLKKKLIAEAFGTFWIVFAGTGAIVVNDMTGEISHTGIALTFGLIVFAMIMALGDISGAHFNPAVSFGFYLSKRIPKQILILYIFSQFAGALLASFILHCLFPLHTTLGATIPNGSAFQSWGIELILMLGLMFVVLVVSSEGKEKGLTAGLAIGSVVTLEALFAGPISGASMNPARSLAPALLSGNLDALWIYLTAPIVGAALAVIACQCSRETGCCSKNYEECNQ